MNTSIIPEIKELKLAKTEINLGDYYIADELRDKLAIADEIFDLNRAENWTGACKYPITHSFGEIQAESYRIIAREKQIEIISADIRGLMYALFTLSELGLINDNRLVELDIYDEPSLALRGLSDDISRGQISTTQNFFEIIRKLARYKYNTYMPYIEDVYRFTSVPAWGRYSDPVGKAEWQAIIEYAHKYQMEVRPILNLLGHFDKLSNIKELQPLALRLSDGTVSHVMDPKNPLVREVIVKMLDEIVDTFGAGIIHAGGDEPVDLTRVYGTDEGGTLFIQHYTFVAEELKKRGCTLMMYGDFFAPPWGDYSVPIDRARELPSDTEFVFWDYAERDEYPLVSALHNQGVKLYISPGSHTWKRFSCNVRTCYNNTKGLLKEDDSRSLGMIMSSWADGGDTLRELTWPGVCIGANFCWSSKSSYDYDVLYEAFHSSFYGFTKEQADLLDNVYHYDYLVSKRDEPEFKNQMWSDPFLPIAFEDRENIFKVQEAMEKAEKDLAELTPKRNQDAFDALYLTVARVKFTADKIARMPSRKLTIIEEGIPYADVALDLADQLLRVKELHKKLWFAANRNSDWDICACRYDDQYDQLKMFARNVRLRKMYNMHV